MASAVCLKCGLLKRHPMDSCRSCGYCPVGDDLAMAKSIVLSDGYQIGEEWRSRTNKELKQIGKAIQSGTEFAFNQDEIDELLEQKKIIDTASPSTWTVFLALLRVFRSSWIFLTILVIFLFSLVLYDAFSPHGTHQFDWSLALTSLALIISLPMVLGCVFILVAIIVYGRLVITRLINMIYSRIDRDQHAKRGRR